MAILRPRKNLIKPLFRSGGTLSEVDLQLAAWIVEQFQCQYSGETLSLTMRQGQTLNPTFWLMLIHKLVREWPKSIDRAVLSRWLAVLLSLYPENTRCDVLCILAASFVFPEDNDIALLTFEFLTRPIVGLEHDLWSAIRDENKKEDVTFELGSRGNGYWLNHFWTKFFETNLDSLGERVEPILRSHLTLAGVLYQTDKGKRQAWDALSLSRNTLEERDHGRKRGGLGVLVDAAFIVAKWYTSSRPGQSGAMIEQWCSSSSFVLKRIAVLMVSEDANRSPDDKLKWLLNTNLLYTYGFKHEVFAVLQNAYPVSSRGVRESVITAIRSGRPTVPKDREDIADYEKYNFMVWLHDCAPDDDISADALKQILASHPQFAPRERPDLDITFGPMQVGVLSPLSLDELLFKKPAELIEYLISYKETRPIGPSREGLIQSVTTASSRDFQWSWKLASELALRDDALIDLWSAVVRAWSGSELSDSQWTDVLKLLDSKIELHGPMSSEIATLLESGTKKAANFIPGDCRELATSLSKSVWRAASSNSRPPTHEEKIIDWVFRAINHPAGTLTLFWLAWLVRRRKEADTNWKGIPEELREILEGVVRDEGYAGVLGRVLLSSQLNLLYAADEAWAVRMILPLFDWDLGSEQAVQSFNGFLVWGQQTDLLLPRLLPMYEKAFPHAAELGEVRSRFTEYLAGLAATSSINPIQHGWLSRFISLSEDTDRRSWASQIRHFLRSFNDASRSTVWQNWIKDYWSARLLGLPVLLEPIELGEMVEWSLYLGSGFPEAAGIISRGPHFELRHSSLFRELAETNLPVNFPGPTATLLLSVLRNTAAAQFDLDKVDDVVRRISPLAASPETLSEICNQLARLGYPTARALEQWLHEQQAPHG